MIDETPHAPEPDLIKQPPQDGAVPVSSEQASVTQVKEIGGRGGLDPTRYGDWEKNGRCIDF